MPGQRVTAARVKSNALGTIGGFHSIKKLTSLVWKALWTDYLSRYHWGARGGDPRRGIGRGGGGGGWRGGGVILLRLLEKLDD